MGESWDTVAIGVVSWLVAVSVVMAAVGIWLGRSHRLRSWWIGLAWSILSVAPLFVAGAYLYLHHRETVATDGARPGVTVVAPGPLL